MSQQYPNQPGDGNQQNQGYGGPAYQQYPDQRQPQGGTGLAITALIVGIVALVLSVIPVLGMVSIVLGLIAVVFGIIAIVKKTAGKGMAITGIILGALGAVVAMIITALLGAAFTAFDQEMNAEHTVEYVVTSAGDASVSYWSGNGTSSADITGDWSEEFTVTGPSMASLTVTGEFTDDSGEVTCEIIIDGETVSENSGSGAGATASCSGTGFGQ